jgi:hypothetical protein
VNASNPAPDIERLLAEGHARKQPPKKLPLLAAMKRDFQALGEDRYRLAIAEIGVTVEVDRLRRDHHELVGELSVRCELPGARPVDGTGLLSIADMNLSSARARQDRAKLLIDRANTGNQLDWVGLVEEFCQADRQGQPSVDLRTVERPNRAEAMLEIAGLVFPKCHPTIIFGDGDTGKSYLALWIAGSLAEMGLRVVLIDWELEHRERLELLFPDGMPYIEYMRCERALVHEADRIRRIVREKQIEFGVYDSVGAACDGPPESAETAGRYFRAVRQIGVGSLHIAHITKGENGDQKPFGSVFWHNLARCTCKRLGLFNRKANLGPRRQAVGFTVTFTDDRTTFRRSDVADSPELAGKLTVCQRMMRLLRSGAMETSLIAEEIEAKVETVERTARRYKGQFKVLPGGRIGLLEKRTL